MWVVRQEVLSLEENREQKSIIKTCTGTSVFGTQSGYVTILRKLKCCSKTCSFGKTELTITLFFQNLHYYYHNIISD